MNGAQALVEMLIAYDTQVIFGLPGDTSIDLYDALNCHSKQIKHVVARDERGAAFMADVYARLSGKPGVCEGPSGGGATYMLPGVVEAHQSSTALIALTTDNPLNYEASSALTELDQPGIYTTATKWAPLVKHANMLPRFVRRAFRMATSGRPGAVHLTLPKDVLGQALNGEMAIYAEEVCKTWPAYRTRPDAEAVRRAARKLLTAQRPVIVAGGGVLISHAENELLAVAQMVNAPVATTINGKGAIAEILPLSLGTIGGNGGRPFAHQIIQAADLVLFVGTKVNYVDTDNWRLPSLASHPTILQIDVDPTQIGNNYPLDGGLCGDAQLALADLLHALEEDRKSLSGKQEWLDEIASLKRQWRSEWEKAANSQGPIMPQRVFTELEQIIPEEAVYVCDPGTATPYMAQGFQVRHSGRSIIFPRAQGGLGYSIPGIVGARFARPNSPVVGLCGDGSFAMSSSDLATVARVGGPVILILFNNKSYGWIKALQRLHSGERYFSTDLDEPVDYVRVAEGFGWQGAQVSDPDEIGPALRRALDHGAPFLIEIMIQGEHQVIPPVAEWQRLAGTKETGE